MSAPQHPPGTFDVLPPETARWEGLLTAFARTASSAGFGLLIAPTFEDLSVFQRVGESTDVVRKQMYDFQDKGGRRVALRPELTAQVVRVFIEHRPPVPWKVWCAGSSFRFERPQAGRYREFHQVDLEVIGSADPDVDVEVIALGLEYYAAVGLERVELLVNSLGDDTCRPAYRKLLVDYLTEHRAELCDEHGGRTLENPLRVLDCKRPECQQATADAPRQIDHLCDDCAAHFARVRAGLDALGITHRVDPRLVRGLDYYTRTAFEYVSTALESAQNAVGGGGRYDKLVEEMGGPDVPAIGLALGLERILLALDAEGVRTAERPRVDVFVVDFAGGDTARDLTATLRAAGLRVDRAFDARSPRAQLKAADRSGAVVALIVGPDEVAAGTVAVKDLRSDAAQVVVDRDEAVAEARRRVDG
jgi:histidyl-tRNA synthetase